MRLHKNYISHKRQRISYTQKFIYLSNTFFDDYILPRQSFLCHICIQWKLVNSATANVNICRYKSLIYPSVKQKRSFPIHVLHTQKHMWPRYASCGTLCASRRKNASMISRFDLIQLHHKPTRFTTKKNGIHLILDKLWTDYNLQ